MILGMIWSIFLRYQSVELEKRSKETGNNEAISFNADMLNWIETQKDKDYTEQISSFSSKYWSDGKIFASILAPIFPEDFAKEITDVFLF